MLQSQEFEFDGQRPGEEVVLVGRRHPWVMAKTGFFIILLLLVVFWAVLQWGLSLASDLVLVLALIIGLITFLVRWQIYTNDIYILTGERIINLEQKNLFFRRVSEVELAETSSIIYEIKGIIKHLLNFGDVIISTVGDDVSTIILKDVENPHFVHERLVSIRKKAL